MAATFRRIVTGHNPAGKSIFVSDGQSPATFNRTGGTIISDYWVTGETPASNAGNADGAPKKFDLHPPHGGSVFRMISLPPDKDRYGSNPEAGRPDHAVAGRHPGFHKTDTIDYAIVLEGEVWAMMDEGEDKLMKAGDVLVQRGTSHAWSNRSDKHCLIAFILIDAKPAP
jgi:hypothetical protein